MGTSEPPTVTTPDLRQYSKPVQGRAADELEAISQPPCSPQQTEQVSDCSALKLMIPEYLRLRDEVRALNDAGDD